MWLGPAGLGGACFAFTPQEPNHLSVPAVRWAHAGGKASYAVAAYFIQLRRPHLNSPESAHGRRLGSCHGVFTLWDAVFLGWDDYEESGTVVRIATFPFLRRLPNLNVLFASRVLSVSFERQRLKPVIEALIFVRVAAVLYGVMARPLNHALSPRSGSYYV